MNMRVWLPVVLSLLGQAVYAAEYKSAFGFTYELPDGWVVLKKEEVKTRFKGENFGDFGLDHLNKENAVAILKRIKDGQVEYIFDRKNSTPKFRNNISLQREAGRTAMTKEEADRICKTAPEQLKKLYGKNTALVECGYKLLKGVPYLSYEYKDAVPGSFTVQYEFQLSPNVTLLLVAAGLQQHGQYVKSAAAQVAQGMAVYVNKSPDYFGMLKQAMVAFQKGDAGLAYKKLQQLADIGDRDGQYNLGVMYTQGKGVQKDDRKAAYWYEKAAMQGHRFALNNLANAYLNGVGVTKDIPRAAHLFGIAARANVPMAQNVYGVMLVKGMGIKKDVNQGIQWMFRAAQQGFAPAINNLIGYFTPPAEKGEKEAMHNLGLLYLQIKQADKGVPWLEKASRAGFAKSTQVLEMLRKQGAIK